MPPLATATKTVLDIARGYIGQHEVPMGSNTGPFVQACQRHTFLGGTGWPWCAAFCHRVFDEAGFPFPYKSASAFGMYAWAAKAGWSRAVPSPAMLGVVNEGAGHICIVESYDAKTQIVTSIDGNVSDQVARRTRKLGEFRGFIFNSGLAGGVHPAPVIKPPLFEVTTSASGHKKVVLRAPRTKVAQWLANTPVGVRFPNGITIRRSTP